MRAFFILGNDAAEGEEAASLLRLKTDTCRPKLLV
jgi:hypothetical protein